MAYYILFDTETTGGGEEDRIIQIGAIIIDQKGNIESFDELVKAPLPIKIDAMEVHNITPDMIENACVFGDTSFIKRLQTLNNQENYLIAHNLPFDLGMLAKEGFVSQLQHIDTLRCAKHLFDDMPYHRLQYLRYALELYKQEIGEAQKLGITIKAHDALSDVLVMKLFVSKLVSRAKNFDATQNPMAVLANLTKKPVLVKEFRFGKYKGMMLGDVVMRDRGYLEWMVGNMELDEDLKYSIQSVLEGGR